MLKPKAGSMIRNTSSPHSSIILDLKTSRSLGYLRQIHAKAIKTGETKDPLVAAEILRSSALSNHRDLLYARHLFDQMPDPNCFSWNTIIRAMSESSDENPWDDAILLFHEMLCCESVRPNKYTFPSVLKACALIEAIEEGEQVHCHAIKMGFGDDGFVLTNLVRMYSFCGRMEDARRLIEKSPLSTTLCEANVVMRNVMIDGYFRFGMTEHARWVFEEMPVRSMISWNGMISRYAQSGFCKDAVDVFREMQLRGASPNYVTLVSVLPAISWLGALELGKWVHIYAEKNGIEIDDVLGSALVDMYSKCGHIEKAIRVFEMLPKSNPITWSALIGGLAMHGRAKEALNLFLAMERIRVMPNDVVFIGVLNACSHAGLVDQGYSYFDRMVRVYGLRPRIEHYGCLVDMLGRAGLLIEAEELVTNMPIKPVDVVYKTLLSACKTHGNLEIGARVADRLLELVPCDGGCNVLLSNFYASLGDWRAVAKVRLKMKELNLTKDPGCSWITIDGIIHEFVVEDDYHLRAKEIYSMLEDMAHNLRTNGNVPENNEVLVNFGEEEREYALAL